MPILELELMELAADGDREELEARVRELTKSQHIHVMRVLCELDDVLCGIGGCRWDGAEYWFRGVTPPAV